MHYNLSKNSMVGFKGFYDNKNGDMAKKVKLTSKLLDLFNGTNNGVIYTNNARKGGASRHENINPLNTCRISKYSDTVLDICNKATLINDFTKFKNYIETIQPNDENKLRNELLKIKYRNLHPNMENITELIDDNKQKLDDIILESYVNKQFPEAGNFNVPIHITEIIGDHDLKNYIDKHIAANTAEKKINILKYDEDGKYKINDLEKVGERNGNGTDKNYVEEGDKNYIQDFSHSGYNGEIVQAYEKNYIENLEKLPEFMDKQYKFIKSMSIAEKIIINDYTKISCFHFYSAYASKMINDNDIRKFIENGEGLWVTKYEDYVSKKTGEKIPKYYFGDSLFKQILEVIEPERFNPIIKANLQESYKSIYTDVKNIGEYWEFLKTTGLDRANPNSMSIFKDELKNDEWDKVIRYFIRDIDEIIANAPETSEPIYCYRATGFDYINLNTDGDSYATTGNHYYNKDNNAYTNIRIGSFSLNFDSSNEYLEIDEATNKKKGTMYRVLINQGVKVLYIPSLSFASHEFEILHASYAIFTHKDNNYLCYNNKKNKYGILSYSNDEFNSAIVGLAGYGKHISKQIFEGVSKNLLALHSEIIGNKETRFSDFYNTYRDRINKIDKIAEKVKELNDEADGKSGGFKAAKRVAKNKKK